MVDDSRSKHKDNTFSTDPVGIFSMVVGKGLQIHGSVLEEILIKVRGEKLTCFSSIISALGGGLETAKHFEEVLERDGSVKDFIFDGITRDNKRVRFSVDAISCILERLGRKNDMSIHGMVRECLVNMPEKREASYTVSVGGASDYVMEATDRMAGGIAHELNTALTVILGYSEMLAEDLERSFLGIKFVEEVNSIISSSNQLARLGEQLLAVVSKQIIQPKVLHLNHNIQLHIDQFTRMVGEKVSLQWSPFAKELQVVLDPLQLKEILTILLSNARDAIVGTGCVTISTWEYILSPEGNGIPEGRYIGLSVDDDGAGMSEETLDRIFQPFFTTKEIGKGVGLGLSVAYGLVRQNKGYVRVESTPKEGSHVHVYFPAPLNCD